MPTLWQDDNELFALAKAELFTAVVGDILDKLGYRRRFLPPRIRPLAPEMVVIGRAMTVLEADCEHEASSASASESDPFGLMIDALDDLKANEVYLAAGGTPRYALWGELMSVRAMRLGAVGVVADGYVRDTLPILALGFPTFAHGSYAQDQNTRGEVVDFRTPIEIEGVRVKPGEIVFGDVDGVVTIPREAEEEVFAQALEKARGEKTVRQALENGMSVREAFAKYGIL